MDLISSHISKFIDGYIKMPDQDYQTVYELIPYIDKPKHKKFLIYLDKLLNDTISVETNGVRFTHLHILGADREVIDVVSCYFLSKCFILGVEYDNTNSDYLDRRLETLAAIIKNRPWPQDAKHNNRASQNEKEFREKFKSNVSFLNAVRARKGSLSLNPETIVNLSLHQSTYVDSIFGSKEVFVPIETFPKSKSYVLTNTSLSRDQIDRNLSLQDDHIFEGIHNVVMFDCEQKLLHRAFNTRDLNEWNRNGCNFKNLIVVTFSNDRFLYSKVRREVLRVHSRFNTSSNAHETNSVIVTEFETSHLLDKPVISSLINPTPLFFGEETCAFWQEFLFILDSHENLYEFRSLKLMNIYSLVTTVESKDLLLQDLFSFTDSKILSDETTEILNELPPERLSKLKASLSYTLDWIIGSNWRDEIVKNVDTAVKIVVSELVLRYPSFAIAFAKSVGFTDPSNLITWQQIQINSNVLILHYKDIGAFPFEYESNYVGIASTNHQVRSQLLLSIFFKGRFQWSLYNLNKERIKILSQPFRKRFFEWENLISSHNNARPNKTDGFKWDYEKPLQEGYQSQTVKVFFKGVRKTKSYFASDLFVVAQGDGKELEVMTLTELLEEDVSETSFKIQHLESLYSDANFFEKSAKLDFAKVKSDTEPIRMEHGITNEVKIETLWKVLLQIKSESNEIYDKLKEIFDTQQLSMVSKHTLTEYWMNPNSRTLVPRENKAFASLCSFLNLPVSYYLWMLKLKNAEKLEARNSSRHMNSLLADLINDGCFNEGADSKMLVTQKKIAYLQNHRQKFEQFGFVPEKIVDDLCTLVDLLKPFLKLKPLEKLEANEQ